MAEIKCKKCNRHLGEESSDGIKLHGKGISVMSIFNQSKSIKISCRSCSTDYNLIDGHLQRDDKSTNRKLLDQFSEGRGKKN